MKLKGLGTRLGILYLKQGSAYAATVIVSCKLQSSAQATEAVMWLSPSPILQLALRQLLQTTIQTAERNTNTSSTDCTVVHKTSQMPWSCDGGMRNAVVM